MAGRRADLVVWWGLLRRALIWRRSSSVALVVVAVVAIGGAAVGPVYLRAADDSTLTSTLAQAPSASTSFTVTSTAGAAGLARVSSAVDRAGRLGPLVDPVISAEAGVTVTGVGQTYASLLLAKTAVCAHVRLVSGSCPTSPGAVALSVRSAHQAGLRVGEQIRLRPTAGAPLAGFRVVGLYAVPPTIDDRYWQGIDYFDQGTGSAGTPRLDALLAARSTLVSSARRGAVLDSTGVVTLRPGALRAGQVGAFEASLRSFTARIGTQLGLAGSTPLYGVFAGASHSEHLMATVVDGIVLQLVLLGLLILFGLVDVSGRDRAQETAIARRRGFTRAALLVVAIGEPVVLLLVAFPLGVLLAWLAVRLIGSGLFVAGTPVGLTWSGVLAGLAGFAGGVAASVAASRSLWQRADRPGEAVGRSPAAGAAIDALAVALAAAGLVALSARGSLSGASPDPVAAVAPGLLAVGAGVIGLRLAAVGVRGLLRVTRRSVRVALFLAVREVGRRQPPVLRQVLPLTAAVVLTIFAVNSWALAAANRTTVAAVSVGAARVDDVQVRPGVNLIQAVDRADPSGRQAMAVAVATSGSGQLLAVQASRLARVGAWAPGLSSRSLASIGRYLTPPTPAPLTFTGPSLGARVVLSAHAPPVDLSATVFNLAGQNELTIDVGVLRPGAATYTGSLGGFCATTCRLVNLSPTLVGALPPHSPPIVRVTITALAADGSPSNAGRLPLGVGRKGSWTAVPSSVGVTTGGKDGISFTVPSDELSSEGILLSPADVPAAIPAVVTTGLTTDNTPQPPNAALQVTGLDGGILNLSAQVEVPTLPAIGGNAAMINLSFAQLAQTTMSDATDQVWLTDSAPPGIESRLRAAGVTVTSTTTAASERADLDKGPLALAYDLVLYAAPVSALLAVGATAFALLASGRRRRTELGSLTGIGIPRAVQRRSVLYETGTVLAVTWIIGIVVGVGASHLALASLPEFPHGTGGIPLPHAIRVGPLVAVAASLGALFALTGSAITRLITRRGPSHEGERP